MYTGYWQFAQKPFDYAVDPEMYYPAQTHQGALLKLRYALESGQSTAVLAGPPGTGKSLLVRLLIERISETHAPVVKLLYPAVSAHELLGMLANGLGCPLNSETSSADRLIVAIQDRLARIEDDTRRALLVVDEAQLLSFPDAYEALRLLLNFETQGRPALTLLLVGQTGLLPTLERIPALEQRVGVTCMLRPLTLEETMGYVQHRLATAGATQQIFTTAGLERLYQLSEGVPRRINRLCDLALLVGYAEDRQQVEAAQLDQIAEELTGASSE